MRFLVPSPARRSKNGSGKFGFTLIELLVVIAIIGVLAALALPIYNSSRKKSMRVQTVNNLKTVSTGFLLYLADNNNSLPIGYQYADPSTQTPEKNWRQSLVDGKYLGTENKPSNAAGSYSYEFSVLGSPLQRANNRKQPAWDWATFGANTYALQVSNVGQNKIPYNLVTFEFPSRTVLLAEGSTFGTTRFNSLFQGSAPNLPDYLEGGMVTCSFFDAHVETMPLASWPKYSEVNAQTRNDAWKFWVGR